MHYFLCRSTLSFESPVIWKTIRSTHQNAVLVVERVRLELVRRVVFIGGQQLAQSQAFDVGLCRDIERKTGDGFHTSPGALGNLYHRAPCNWVDIEVVQ